MAVMLADELTPQFFANTGVFSPVDDFYPLIVGTPFQPDVDEINKINKNCLFYKNSEEAMCSKEV